MDSQKRIGNACQEAGGHLDSKVLSTLEGLLIHPAHVLLVVCVKLIACTLLLPLYEMCILYAMRRRPAPSTPFFPDTYGPTHPPACWVCTATLHGELEEQQVCVFGIKSGMREHEEATWGSQPVCRVGIWSAEGTAKVCTRSRG